MSTALLIKKVEAIDTVQSLLEELGTELISHPELDTKDRELKIAMAYTAMKQTLREEVRASPPSASLPLFDLETETRITRNEEDAAPA